MEFCVSNRELEVYYYMEAMYWLTWRQLLGRYTAYRKGRRKRDSLAKNRRDKTMSRQISFPYDRNKAVQTVLWLLDQHGGKMDKLKLVKLLFYADREHLARYRRPITGGNYVAMPHGPASSELLDDLKGASSEGILPFSVEGGRRVITNERYDEDELSESDIEVLKYVNAKYGPIGTYRLRDRTHRLEAWKQNYHEDTSRALPYEDFFLDLDDDSVLEAIQEDQEVRDFFLT